MKVTRILHAKAASVSEFIALKNICKTVAFMRGDIWRRFGALKTLGKSANDIRKEIHAAGWYKKLLINGTLRAATVKDIVNDILLYKAAAKTKVRQAIYKRTSDKEQRKHLYNLLKKDEWFNEPFLHRQMRKHFRHGRAHCDNQFIVRSDRHIETIIDKKLHITINLSDRTKAAQIAQGLQTSLTLISNSSGKNVALSNANLRVILKGDSIEVHYATEKEAGRPCGSQEIGIDKGYTEAFTDSDGIQHGCGFGASMTKYSDQILETNKARNKLHALAKLHKSKGRLSKADKIKHHNLGRIKLNDRKERVQKRLRTIAYKAAHSLVDKAGIIVSEDLSSTFASKNQWKNFNRRMSSWAKGVLAKSVQEVSKQRGAKHVLVNAAYTSQMDSLTGRLEGVRKGEKFYRANGDVLQADFNAARNVLARMYDPDIDRYTPYNTVKQTLLARFSAQLSVSDLS